MMAKRRMAHALRAAIPVVAVLILTGAARGSAQADALPVRLPTPTVSISTNAVNGVTGGTAVTGTVTVTDPLSRCPSDSLTTLGRVERCLSQDLTVTLTAACLNLAGTCPTAPLSLPATLNVHSGTPKTFAITTTPVSAENDVPIVAVFEGTTGVASLKVLPPKLTSLTIAPSSIVAGSSFHPRVCLDGPAPASGEDVVLESNYYGWGQGSMPVQSGALCEDADFHLPDPSNTGTFTFTARLGDQSIKAKLTVTAPAGSGPSGTGGGTGSGPAALQFITIDGRASETFYSSASSPVTVSIAVLLTAPAGNGGAVVGISSQGPTLQGDDASPYLSAIPTSITVPQGQSSAGFQLQVSGCPSYSTGVYCDAAFTATFQGQTVGPAQVITH